MQASSKIALYWRRLALGLIPGRARVKRTKINRDLRGRLVEDLVLGIVFGQVSEVKRCYQRRWLGSSQFRPLGSAAVEVEPEQDGKKKHNDY